MRIAVSGTQCTGKSTFIKDFINKWPMYKLANESCTSFVTDNKLKHSQDSDENTQDKILTYLTDTVMKYTREDNVIYDRCPIDNLAYTMWLHTKDKVTDSFLDKTIKIVRESTRFLDIVFFIPLTKVATIPIVENGTRDIDPTFREEIDNIFKAICNTYYKQTGAVFIKDDSPAVIEIFGKPEERLTMAEMYINKDGKVYGEDDSLIYIPPDFSAEDFA